MILLLWVCLWGAPNLPAATQEIEAEAVKATFLFHFSHFIEWPSSAFTTPSSPFVIGILETDSGEAAKSIQAIYNSLTEIVKDEKVNQRPLQIVRCKQVEEARNCHILYFPESNKNRLENLLEELDKKPILTVGEDFSFINRGGIVQFIMANNKVRLRIHLDRSRSSQLKISTNLLRVADVVGQD